MHPPLSVRCALACAAHLLLVGPALAQERPPAPRGYESGIDALDYDVHLDLPDTGSFLRGEVIVTVRRSASTPTLRLDLVDAMTVREVTVDGRAVGVTRAENRIDIPLPAASADTIRVRVRYDGTVTDGLIVQRDTHGRWTWFGDNWPNRAHYWLPSVDHPSDKATVSFTVRAGSNRTVVANGAPLGVRLLTGADSGRSETRWRESRPIPVYLMVIGAAPLVRTDLPAPACTRDAVHSCAEQMVYTTPEARGWMPGPFASAGAIVAWMEETVGPFPYEKLAHVQSATRFGGMENASAIFYADHLFVDRRLEVGLIAHETAHQWFGDAVTERQWSDLWLSEGFATYFAALWTRHARGDAAFGRELAAMREKIMLDSVVATRPVLDTAQTNYVALLNANSYEKGGYTLHMLHQEIGDSAFHAGIRAYYAKYRDGNATTDDLRHELETASGRPLEPFFDQWLRRPGVAALTVGWAHDPETGALSLLVLQPGPRLPYAMRLTVAVTGRTGETRRLDVRLPADHRATIVLPGFFRDKPTRVVVDPDAVLLARIITL